jgi:hypothetical protein
MSTSPQPFRLHVAESAIDGQLGSTECSFEGEVALATVRSQRRISADRQSGSGFQFTARDSSR